MSQFGGPAVVAGLQAADCAREVAARFSAVSAICGSPDCEWPVNPDPAVSVGFCCEKCEGRFKGEEWAMGGRKKHTANCTSRKNESSNIPSDLGELGMSAGAYGPAAKAMKC